MGLIKALTSSTSQALGDQFKEFVTCPTMGNGVLIQRGNVQHGKGNSNPSDGVLSNGTVIAVPAGTAMMIIENGAIKEFTAEAGEYTFDTSSEPSIFTGSLGDGISNIIKTIGNRITYGGQPAKDQRVYFVNLLNMTGNKFGSPQPRKITDDKYGMIEVTFFGEYAFKVVDPATLVSSVIGANPSNTVTLDDVMGSQLKSKFVEKLSEAITKVMRLHKVPFGDILMYNSDITNEMNVCLDDSWHNQYGLEVTDVALADINLTDESMARVNKIDDATIFSNQGLQSGLMASATADAMKSAASNENGAMMGFMGMNMAQNTGVNMMNAVNPNGETVQPTETNTPEPGTLFKKEEPIKEVVAAEVATTIEESPTETTTVINKYCTNCGAVVTGNFCGQCGTKVN